MDRELLSILALFGPSCYSVISPGIRLTVRNPADKSSVAAWEQRNSVHLPIDLKNFYYVCDGITIKYGDSEDALSMNINSIAALQRLGTVACDEQQAVAVSLSAVPEYMCLLNHDYVKDEGNGVLIREHPVLCPHSKIYELARYKDGCFCLAYDVSKISCRPVWFLDRALEWQYVAPNFTSFFRRSLGSFEF